MNAPYRLVRPAVAARPRRLDDPVQRHVVAHRDGPLLVVGGPGTGKTATLVEAVAARVAEGTAASAILVLTFGRRGALRLRDAIEARLGLRDATTMAEPMVRTFHGYAFGLLRRAAVARGEPPPRLLTGPEQDLVIRELLADAGPWPESLQPALQTRAFATELRDLLLRAVERGVDPSGLAALAVAHRRADWAAAARFYNEYLQVLALREASGQGSVGYDYAELVRAATALLRADRPLLDEQRRQASYVYVDELADTDPTQVDLLATIAGGGSHLVAFADPDSATFAFRGADRAIVGEFGHRFRTASGALAPQVTMTVSYRAGGELLAAMHRVATRLRGPSRHRELVPSGADAPDADADADAPGVLEVRTFRSETTEAAYLAHRLREAHLLHGVPWSRMAVLIRSTALQLAPVQRALRQAGVPVAVPAEDLPLHVQPAVAPLLLLLRCALDPGRLDEDAAVALIHSPLGGADPLAERRLRQGLRALAIAAGDRRPSGVLLVEALLDTSELAAVPRRWAAPAQAIGRLLRATQEAAGLVTATSPAQGARRVAASAEEVLWAAWHGSGLAQRWSAISALGGQRGAAADRDLDAVVALFDAAARFTDRLPGAGAAVFLDHVEGQDLPSDSIAPTAHRGGAVQVMTAHAAKGLEWDLVVLAGVQEGIWPDLRLRGSVLGSEELVDLVAGRSSEPAGRLSALLDEERRLFYVAASRARQRLLVTAVAAGDDEEQPSRFLGEIDPDGHPQDPDPVAPPRPLTLAALVAELRTVAADATAQASRRGAAACLLADLAEAGVRGADPDQWWGLRQLSDLRPLVDDGAPVRVTPSTVDSVQRCSLRWLLERHGGGTQPSPEQGIGNLVHAAATLASDATADRAALVSYVAERFDAIELSARWLAGRERERVDVMLDKLIGWLAGNPRRLLAVERDFLVELTDPRGPIEIRGRVDRLEVDEYGRLVVVDLKTGKTSPAGADLAEHPQLAAYQVAIEAGAFDESDTPGGASLVQLGGEAVHAREQVQPPLAEAGDPDWAQALIRRTARTMAASTFEAVANNKCRVCPVRTSCPVSGKGRQVTDGAS